MRPLEQRASVTVRDTVMAATERLSAGMPRTAGPQVHA